MSERKTREALVIGDKMQKTRVVRIERVHRHPRYGRVVRTAKRLKVHDEANESRMGDRVLIEETRPLSREKRWRIRQILKSAEGAPRAANSPPSAQAEANAATRTSNSPSSVPGQQALR